MRIGSLCSGAGGLDLAVEEVFNARTVWHCEINEAASKVLAHRWPNIPNHRDLIETDWTTVEPVDIVCAGWPCQPFSLAGKQLGAEDERAIWPAIARAIRVLRPRIVCLENVSAVLGSELHRVADSLSSLGYDIAWTCLRASDVGAPHRRDRLFVLAADSKCDGSRQEADDARRRKPDAAGCGGRCEPEGCRAPCVGRKGAGRSPTDAARDGRHEGRPESARLVGGSDAALSGDGPVELLPTPSAADGGGGGHLTRSGDRGGELLLPGVARAYGNGELLPTPTTQDGKNTAGPSQHHRNTPPLNVVATLLPTPAAADARASRDGSGGDEVVTAAVKAHNANQWGKYAPAIARWEQIVGPAPSPTEPNRNGNPRLSPEFSSWMMGWPAGWATDVPGISRNDQLRIIGNGVVPQCAATALRWLLTLELEATA